MHGAPSFDYGIDVLNYAASLVEKAVGSGEEDILALRLEGGAIKLFEASLDMKHVYRELTVLSYDGFRLRQDVNMDLSEYFAISTHFYDERYKPTTATQRANMVDPQGLLACGPCEPMRAHLSHVPHHPSVPLCLLFGHQACLGQP